MFELEREISLNDETLDWNLPFVMIIRLEIIYFCVSLAAHAFVCLFINEYSKFPVLI